MRREKEGRDRQRDRDRNKQIKTEKGRNRAQRGWEGVWGRLGGGVFNYFHMQRVQFTYLVSGVCLFAFEYYFSFSLFFSFGVGRWGR